MRRLAAAALAVALTIVTACDVGTLLLDPHLPSGDPPEPQQRGRLDAAISGDVSLDFKGGAIFVPGSLGFRIRSQGHGELSSQIIDFHDYDRVGELEPGTYAIIEIPTYFQQGFTAFWRRTFTGGSERYTAVEGTLEITQSDWQVVRGRFSFQAVRTEVCQVVDGENDCQPATGNQPQIEVAGELEAMPSRP